MKQAKANRVLPKECSDHSKHPYPTTQEMTPHIDISSVQLLSVSESLWPHGLQHSRLSCPSPTPGACSNWYPSSHRCHPIILSSVAPFSFCLQSFPASGPFPMNQFFVSGSQSIGVSASASVLPMNIQGWFPLGLTGLISLTSKWLFLWPHGLYSPWNSQGQNTRVGSLSVLQGIFPTQGLNPGLPHCRWILYQLSHKGSLT